MSLKHLKEQFVSDLSGGLIQEIYTVTGTALGALIAQTCVQQWVVPHVPILSDLPILFILAFYFDVMVQLQAITIFNSRPMTLYYVVAAISSASFLFNCIVVARNRGKTLGLVSKSKSKSKSHLKLTLKLAPDLLPLGQIPYITAYRSQMLIITNLAILAVDFHIFPRRFAKVETWGTSMMDLGVGLFVFSMGLANLRSLIKKSLASNRKSESYFALLMANTVKALPVLFLGLVRLVSVKSLEYQEHVSEYGVHWNFFMTLGLLPIFLGVVDPLFAVVPRFAVALALGCVYEYVLTYVGLSRFILDESNRQQSLVTLNKEGLASFIGYLSIFIFGQSFGSFVLTTTKLPNNLVGFGLLKRHRRWLTVSSTQGLFVITLLLFTLFYFVNEAKSTGSISRRLANLAYVLWVVSYNSLMLLGYNLVETVFGPINSRILNAINRNGLAIFLAANLATGLINMAINTLKASDGLAYAILVLYALFWVFVALGLDYYKIYIKL